MRDRYDCDIIRDLLPGYVDGILSEAGMELVTAHLKECGQCREAYEEMRADVGDGADLAEAAAVDALKKVRKRTRHLKLAVGCLAGVVVLFIAAVFLKVYVIGEPLSTGQVAVGEVSYDEETDSLFVSGTMNLHSFRISRVSWKPDPGDENIIDLTVWAAETLPFGADQTEFAVTIPDMKGKVAYLSCPEYDRMELYSWNNDHYEMLDKLEEEIYARVGQLDRDRDALTCYGGIDEVEGLEGVRFYVDFIMGEEATYWRSMGHLVTDGDLEPADFELWISLEGPHKILLFDYQTGQYTDDFSIIGERRPEGE